MSAALILLAAASPEAHALATQIAKVTLQPDRVLADSLDQYDRKFEEGVSRASAGRTMTPVQLAKKNRAKAAGKAEMSAQLQTTGIPRFLRLIEDEYQQNFSDVELREAVAFWTSPAGQSLVTAMQDAFKNGSAKVAPPAQHSVAINRHMTSAVGRKESARSALMRPALVREMSSFMQEVQPKIDARMRAAMTAAS